MNSKVYVVHRVHRLSYNAYARAYVYTDCIYARAPHEIFSTLNLPRVVGMVFWVHTVHNVGVAGIVLGKTARTGKGNGEGYENELHKGYSSYARPALPSRNFDRRRLVPSPSTARANGAGLPKTRNGANWRTTRSAIW
jgi:hypothetical protein